MSVPFLGKEFDFTQPDGSALTVRGWGNQNHAVFEALNGYTLVKDLSTGFYTYANISDDGDDLISTGARPRFVKANTLGIQPGLRISAAAAKARAREGGELTPGTSRWEQRRKQARAALAAGPAMTGLAPAPPSRPTVGNFVGLCLLIQFPDVPGTIPQDEVDRFCNQRGYAGFGNNGSVQDYFHDVSGGRLAYQNIVTPYYTAKHPRKYYTDEKIPQPERARELIKEALSWFLAQGMDFSSLTVDTQNYVYATNVFYAGTRINNWSKGLWPHSYHLLTPFQLAPGHNAFDYQITDMTAELSLGTFCHENGHMICDFPDLYDYGYESAGIGGYCLMCAGANISEKDPTDINAYLKYRAGWAQQVTTVTPNVPLTATAASNSFFLHRKSATEYFMLENRYKAGRDAALPSSGLAVWHVDELGNNQNEQMTAGLHYECALVQADGRFDLEHDPRNIGDPTDLFSAAVNNHLGKNTNPSSKWWSGTPSGLELTGIGPAGPAITFNPI